MKRLFSFVGTALVAVSAVLFIVTALNNVLSCTVNAQTLNIYSKGVAYPLKAANIRSIKFDKKITVASSTTSTSTSFEFAAVDSMTVASAVAVTPGTFTLLSSAFKDNGELPKEYTCDGASPPMNISPPLNWENVPTGTKSLAVTMHTIVGPTPGMPGLFDTHAYIVLYNIPATTTSIPKAVSGIGLFGINTVNGMNSYTPPCSAGPGTKAYILTVFALSADPVFTVPQTAVTREVLLAAISKTTLGQAMITVNYTRSLK